MSLFVCVCVCVFVQPFEKINATGVASVQPGEARESIGIANPRQMKFCQWNSPNEVSPNEVRQMKFRQIKKSFGQKKKFWQKRKQKVSSKT